VTHVFKKHCTVVVLDQTLCLATGESSSSHDIRLLSSHWRLGTEAIISGFGGSTSQYLNGSSGTIVRPPEQTHPSFVQRSNKEMFCLLLHVKVQTRDSRECLMVEPKYLINAAHQALPHLLMGCYDWFFLLDRGVRETKLKVRWYFFQADLERDLFCTKWEPC